MLGPSIHTQRRRGFLFILAELCLLVACCIPDTTAAQTSAMGTNYLTVANNFRTMLRPRLTSADQQLLDDVEFVFDDGEYLNAYAYRDGGDPKIKVSLGYIELAYELSVGYYASWGHGTPQCFEQFIRTVAQGIVDDSQSQSNGDSPPGVPSFGKFIGSHHADCGNMTLAEINSPETLKLVSSGMNAIMFYVVGHEFAHHKLGHVTHPTNNNAVSRDHESKADAQSIAWSFDLRLNPFPAFPILVLYSMIGADDREGEIASTHPASSRRYADFLDAIAAKESDVDWYRAKFGSAPTKVMLDSISDMRKQARRLVPE